MGERVYNFSSGPAMLPAEVLRDAAGEMLYKMLPVAGVVAPVDFMRDFEHRHG